MKAIDFIKESNEVFKMEEIVVETNTGKECRVKVNRKFRDSEIANIIDELVLRSEMCKKENIKFNTVIALYVLMFKAFTDIKFSTYPNLKKQYAHEIDTVMAMVDLGVYEQIINELGKNKEEMAKIQDTFTKYGESFKAINNNVISKEILGGEVDGSEI